MTETIGHGLLRGAVCGAVQRLTGRNLLELDPERRTDAYDATLVAALARAIDDLDGKADHLHRLVQKLQALVEEKTP